MTSFQRPTRDVDLVPLPSRLEPRHLRNRVVVVFDVLRATTTMTAALAAGIGEIRVFSDIESARSSADAHEGPRILCGETKCLPPPGFDLGNRPGAFARDRHAAQTAFMATTNGTRAIVAARSAALVLIGALVNARAVARAISSTHVNVTLFCAGTDGAVAPEDLLGAGAVVQELLNTGQPVVPSHDARDAQERFHHAQEDLVCALSATQGGRNVIDAGLAPDIAFAARLNAIDVVGRAIDEPLRVVPLASV